MLYLSDPPGINSVARRRMLDSLANLNRLKVEAFGDPEIETRIAQYEMAYRMQTSVPGLMDLSDEPDYIFELYGPDSRKPGTYAANCLLSRPVDRKGTCASCSCITVAGTSMGTSLATSLCSAEARIRLPLRWLSI